jgi:hypothetical protein
MSVCVKGPLHNRLPGWERYQAKYKMSCGQVVICRQRPSEEPAERILSTKENIWHLENSRREKSDTISSVIIVVNQVSRQSSKTGFYKKVCGISFKKGMEPDQSFATQKMLLD